MGHTLARSFSSNRVVSERIIETTFLHNEEPDVTVTFQDSPYIETYRELVNHGTMRFLSNKHSPGNSHCMMEYIFRKNFRNTGVFVVQHSNPLFPVKVFIYSLTLVDNGKALFSCNEGDIVLASNGTRCADGGYEFLMEIRGSFFNLGTFSVIGTLTHLAEMRLVTKHKRDFQSFSNEGIIYLKNAIFYQDASMLLAGCIAVGEKAVFVSSSRFRIGEQVIYLLSGSSTFYILTYDDKKATDEYIVTSFPRGAAIQVEDHMTRMKWKDNLLTFVSELKKRWIRVRFDFLPFIDLDGFRFENGRLTHVDDLTKTLPRWECRDVDSVVERVTPYEL